MARVCQRCNHQNLSEAKFCLQCGAMLEVDVVDAADPLIGKILLGRYRISRLLGEGGMGKVFLAEQKMGTAVRKVAIKTLHSELGSDPQLVARFHRECETVIELHHPNTVQFYDFGEMEDKTLFIVMEFIEGEDLSKLLLRGALEPSRADRILIQICGSLNEAHQHGIVHRDLKPENVLLTQRGGQADFVKVLDFGIAKRNDAEDESKAKLTKQGTVLGTPPYMSPEQFSGQTLDSRSDIYSLGVMTYEMVTNHLPFEARTPWEWATKHLTQAPAPLESFPEGAALAPNKRAAIMRALSKSQNDRQANVIEFMQEFTGMVDPQAAWTMATSAGLKSHAGISAQQVQAAQASQASQSAMAHTQPAAVVNPSQLGYGQGPMSPGYPHQPSPAYGQAAYPVGAVSTPTHGQAVTPFPSYPGQVGSMPSAPVSSGGGALKWVALVAVLFMGVAAGGLYMVFGRAGDAPVATTGTVGTVGSLATTGTTTSQTPPLGNGAGTQNTATGLTGSQIAADPSVHDAGTTAAATNTVDAGTTATSTTASNEDERPAANENQPSPADLDRARSAVRDAEAAIGRQDPESAVRALAIAQRAVGRSHAIVAGPRANLARIGGRMVGIMIQQNKCDGAQALYRQLRSVGADTNARGQFVPGYCNRP